MKGMTSPPDSPKTGDVMPLIYDELRRLAQRWFSGGSPEVTLQPTALVNEAWIKLARSDGGWNDREHFHATAALAMRQVLLSHAKARGAQKRGGGRRPLSLEEGWASTEAPLDDLLDLAVELEAMRAFDSRKADVVDMRFFGGMTMKEIASVLDVSVRTCEDDWRTARAWLLSRLTGEE